MYKSNVALFPSYDQVKGAKENDFVETHDDYQHPMVGYGYYPRIKKSKLLLSLSSNPLLISHDEILSIFYAMLRSD